MKQESEQPLQQDSGMSRAEQAYRELPQDAPFQTQLTAEYHMLHEYYKDLFPLGASWFHDYSARRDLKATYPFFAFVELRLDHPKVGKFLDRLSEKGFQASSLAASILQDPPQRDSGE